METAGQVYLTGALITAIGTLSGVVVYLWHEYRRLSQAEADCRIKVANLQADTRRLATILEALTGNGQSDAVVTVDERGRIIEWNELATLMFHVEKRHAMGKQISSIIPTWNELVTAAEVPRHGPHAVEAKTKDGRTIPILIRLHAFRNSETGEHRIGVRIRPQVNHNGNNPDR